MVGIIEREFPVVEKSSYETSGAVVIAFRPRGHQHADTGRFNR